MQGAIKAWLARAIDRLSPRLWLELRILRHDRHFEPEFWLIPRLIQAGDVAVDVGANMGHYTVYMAKFARTVHAFEPNPICLQRLRRVAPRNTVLHAQGVADDEGVALLRFDPDNTGLGTLSPDNRIDENPEVNEVHQLEVTTTRLDRLGLRAVSFIKIDVEGFEESVVHGCEGLLETMRPAFLIEVEERHNPGGLARLRHWFTARDYHGLFLADGRLHPIDRFNTAKHQHWGGTTPYINNFIFLHRESPVAETLTARGSSGSGRDPHLHSLGKR